MAAMKKAHPYEVPAFDILKLFGYGNKFGLGRIGRLAEPMKVDQLIRRVKKQTGAKAVGLVGDPNRMVRIAAVCAGTCGTIINSIIAAGADLYLTGELEHHLALAAQEAGLTCVCLSHTVSERFMLRKLAGQLKERTKGVSVKISKADADPFTWKNI
jgi:putative NIF3 family GTP cyclohydrolase 1 type 2